MFHSDGSWWPLLPAAALGAALVCGLILYGLLASGLAWRLATDIPNHRSLHTRPTPRIGGWGIVPVAVIALACLAGAAPALWPVAGGVLLLAAVSQIDDRRGLPARVRFLAHLVAVAAIVASDHAGLPLWAAAALAFLMLWLVNLYNFMDGADGLAGGMALFGFGGYAIAALCAPGGMQLAMAAASAAVAGAALGFLCFNFHPARLFMGDAGSIPLGFLAGALGYAGWRGEAWPLWFPAMVFAPFIADASVTLLRRLLRGDKVWQAHREHYYQRMIQLGLGHARTALYWYAVMLAGVGAALATRTLAAASQQWLACASWYLVLFAVGALIDIRWRRRQAVPLS